MCDLASNTMFKLLSFFTFIYTKGRQINLSLSHLTHSLVMSYRMVREVLSILTAGGKKINIFYKYIRTMVSKSRIWGARRQRSSGLKGLLAVVSLGWRPKISGLVQVQRDGGRVPNFRGCNAETASAKWCADKRSREKIPEATSGITGTKGWT